MNSGKRALLCTVVLLLCLLSGCWSSIEMNKLAFVMGIAVDHESRTDVNEYIVTAQVAKPRLMKNADGKSSSGGEKAYVNYTANGMGIHSSFSKISRMVDRELYTGHNQVLVISSDVAQNSINPILDYFIRSSDGRFTALLFISEGSAIDIFQVTSELEDLSCIQLKNLAESQKRYGEIFSADIRSFLTASNSGTTAPTVPIVRIVEQGEDHKELLISGLAVFLEDAICTTLTPKQGQTMLMVEGQAKNGYLEIDTPDHYIGLEINSSGADIKPVFKGEQLEKITVSIDLACSVVDTNADLDFLSQEVRKEIGGMAEATVRELLDGTLVQTQRFGADIYGFGENLYRYHPKKSKPLIENWGEAYESLSVEFDVKVEILSSGSVLRFLNSHDAQTDYQ